jgi:mono/diheme cytochrome c family protein
MMPRIKRPKLVAFAALAGVAIIAYSLWTTLMLSRDTAAPAPPDPARLAAGSKIYVQHCASCHGANLEGQANWQARLPNGRMPAPPHDDSGHTWHHPDEVLFGITKYGLVPGKYAPPGYQSDMPGFGNVLSDDDIRAVLAYIESRWSAQVRARRAEMLREMAKARGG